MRCSIFLIALKRISFALFTAEVIFISGLVSFRFLFTIFALSFAPHNKSPTYFSALASALAGIAIYKILNTFKILMGLTA
jgi:hypothetical protein